MPDTTLLVLLATAASVGFVHTITGPDHYLPFVAMARIGRWSLAKTITVTLACGVGHVLSSVILGALGIALGLAVGSLEWFEGVRGNLAGWDELRTVQIEIRNTIDLPVTVDIRRHFGTAYWRLERQDEVGRYEKLDADTVKFLVHLTSRSHETVTYQLRTYHGTREEDAR